MTGSRRSLYSAVKIWTEPAKFFCFYFLQVIFLSFVKKWFNQDLDLACQGSAISKTHPIKNFSAEIYAIVLFKHSDWLKKFSNQSECSKLA